MEFIVALDQGTTSSRTIVFTPEGSVVAVAQAEFTQHFPAPGWVEHSPDEIWSSQVGTLDEALRLAKCRPSDVLAVGITNQRETTIIWDRETHQPVTNAIVWQDRRTADLCARLSRDPFASEVRKRTGLPIDPYFSASKIKWILDRDPSLRRRASEGKLAFGTVDSWLIWKLTGGKVHVTDPSNASRTLLFNIRTGRWDDELLEFFSVPKDLLPEVRPSSGVLGNVSTIDGLTAPIAGVAGDQQAALFGQLCLTPGLTKNTYGTGCFLLQYTGKSPPISKNNLLSTVAWDIGDGLEYALEGSVFIGGALIQWLRDGLGILTKSSDVEELAAEVPDSGGIVLVPAFAGLGAPYWDSYARGALVGLTRGTTKAHIARAAEEAIALQVAELSDAMAADVGTPVAELRVDGGGSRDNLLLQIQADVLGVPVVRAKHLETTALGAAYLAALGVKAMTRESLNRTWSADRRFTPSGLDVSALKARWKKGVERSRGWEEAQAGVL